eukprot:6431848-Alexandrium_andersonii.AAC.1
MPTKWLDFGKIASVRDSSRVSAIDPLPLEDGDTDRLTHTLTLEVSAYGQDIERLMQQGPGMQLGARRFLQHRGPLDLFWNYCAVAR